MVISRMPNCPSFHSVSSSGIFLVPDVGQSPPTQTHLAITKCSLERDLSMQYIIIECSKMEGRKEPKTNKFSCYRLAWVWPPYSLLLPCSAQWVYFIIRISYFCKNVSINICLFVECWHSLYLSSRFLSCYLPQVRQNVPRVSYISLLDIWMLVSEWKYFCFRKLSIFFI